MGVLAVYPNFPDLSRVLHRGADAETEALPVRRKMQGEDRSIGCVDLARVVSVAVRDEDGRAFHKRQMFVVPGPGCVVAGTVTQPLRRA